MSTDKIGSKKKKSGLDTSVTYSVNTIKRKGKRKPVEHSDDEVSPKSKKRKQINDETHYRNDEIDIVNQNNSDIEDTYEEETDDLVAVKQELSSMSFEELLQLKERLGLKVYNQVVHGDRVKKQTKKTFKRENKNRPTEMSSKRPVYSRKDSLPIKKKMTRDPRFDDLSGEYNEHYFKANYSFILDIKAREKEKIKKKITKEKEPEKKGKLKNLYNRMDQQEQAEKQKDKRKALEKEWKKKEQSLVQHGKKPFFLKKADLRKLELAEKYKELQKSGKLEKYLSKKRKKTAQKEKKKLPMLS